MPGCQIYSLQSRPEHTNSAAGKRSPQTFPAAESMKWMSLKKSLASASVYLPLTHESTQGLHPLVVDIQCLDLGKILPGLTNIS